MSFIGSGNEDWVELDMDLFDRQRLGRLKVALEDDRDVVVASVGADYEVEIDDFGNAFLLVDGERRYRAEVNTNDRLMLTGILDPDGPL
ncbi:MAG: hypothetical protein ACI8TP_005053 [Acidimicrobiales bacterium]|jgi:hypothetical protein